MQRAIGVIPLLLLVVMSGVIVNVAVAWGCYLACEKRSASPLMRALTESEVLWWRQHVPAGFVDQPRGVVEWRNPGRHTITLTQHEVGGFLATFGEHHQEERSGWPCVSMKHAAWISRAKAVEVRSGALTIPWTWWPFANRDLPLRPHWPGFATNTIEYAAVMWLFGFAMAAVKRRRRLARKLCPKCAYPAGVSTVCTECGAVLVRQPSSASTAS
jgi:hypothetical protein